jgi:hypothetical protein
MLSLEMIGRADRHPSAIGIMIPIAQANTFAAQRTP